MEKLYKLLNEYVEEKGMALHWSLYDDELFIGEHGDSLSETILISRNYGFISWLLENKKVNLDKIPIRVETYYQNDLAPYILTDDIDILLMILNTTFMPIPILIDILVD